ncbi:MAG: hypothetical protein ACKOXF_07045 [Chitinophagaceae bacterium]
MINKCLILLCQLSATALLAQDNKYNIVFKPEQTTLGEQQKKEINFIASRLMEGESILLYPLAYDSIMDIYNLRRLLKPRQRPSPIMPLVLDSRQPDFPAIFLAAIVA